jgi:flagellar motor switch protein FliN/FliY
MTIHQPAAFSRFGDVAVRLSVELGRTDMPLRDVLLLGEGSTVALDRLTDELLDVTANGRVIARGEVVAEKGRFALRIVTLVGEDGQDVPPASAPAAAEAPVGAGDPA